MLPAFLLEGCRKSVASSLRNTPLLEGWNSFTARLWVTPPTPRLGTVHRVELQGTEGRAFLEQVMEDNLL
jgi:hypothetical protein